MKKILVINGSPRLNGNTDYIVNYLKSKFTNIEFCEWILRDTNIHYCLGCELCHDANNIVCYNNDDFYFNSSLILNSESILIISPVYQGGVSGLIKIWMDRCEMFRKGRLLKDKICGGIAVGGYEGGGQESTLIQIQTFAHITCMKYSPSLGSVRSHFGGYCVAYKKGEVKNDDSGLVTCENVIKNMISMISNS